MELDQAVLYYGTEDSSATILLPSPPAVWHGQYGNVTSVKLKQSSISFIQKRKEDSCVADLEGRTFSIRSFSFERPYKPQYFDQTVLVATLECYSSPKCKLISNRHPYALPKAEAIPLYKRAGEMRLIRLELNEEPSKWTVRGTRKAQTAGTFRCQLERLYAPHTSLASTDPESQSQPKVESDHGDAPPARSPPVSLSGPEAVSAAAGGPPFAAPSNGHPTSLPLPATLPPSASHPIAGTLPPPAPPRSTTRQHPRVLKRKVEEMEAQYNEIEEEEEEFVVRCGERKEQLWQKLRSGDPPTSTGPRHPSGLKRRLEEMEVQYDGIEKEEEEFMVRCRERKAKLWEDFHNEGF